ncbi:hypothetical protein ACFVYV_52965 [Streptomyces mirabilis]|uniref:hypothetical protein n=1 Tax=Streptomyces mirabilis TaxID=68239 RepID=UPI0036DC2D10
MDAAIAGLIGSLGGVIVGAGAQAAQAARSRKWQIADQDRTAAEQQETRLWQERRIAYAAFMDAEMDATNKVQWAWLINSTGPAPDEHPRSPEATEALERASESIAKVSRLTQEVLLLTTSDAVRQAVDLYSDTMNSFNPNAAHCGNPNRSEQGQALVEQLAASHSLFVVAARKELRIGSNRPSGPSRGRQRVLNDNQR